MTNEERQQAIEWLKRRPVMMAGAKRMYNLAVEALEAYVPDINVGDMVSRQAAVEIAMEYCPDDDGSVGKDGDLRDLLDELENLPPVQPKRGKWKDGKCDQRSGSAPFWPLANTYYCSNFCPNCGADMRGGSDGAD